jgi:hypothetical protein
MPSRTMAALALAALTLAALAGARACSLCGNPTNQLTLREDAAAAKLILYGTLTNPRLSAAARGGDTNGAVTDLHVEQVIKGQAILAGRKVLTLPKYVPVDPKAPPKFLVFCDVGDGRLDPYRGSPAASPAVVEYLRGALALDPNDRPKLLAYFFCHLDDADPEIAADAFREFAKTGDADIARTAKQLDPAKLRRLVTNLRTPPERLSLFAYLLGGCGTESDADLLARLMRQPDEHFRSAFGGLLAGYAQLRPAEGWALTLALLGDPKRPFPERNAALATVRFFYRSQPGAMRGHVLKALAVLLPQGDMADLAVEDLRHWQEWDLTADVLAQYGKKSHEAPMVRRAIVRYALCCPRPEARSFVNRLRQADPGLVRDVEEALQFERTPASAAVGR